MAERRDIHDLMMDYLYGELTESEKVDFEQRVAADPASSAELESLRRTREAVKSMALDEDPPQALSAILLHAAAQGAGGGSGSKRAVTVEKKPGPWARFVDWWQPLVRHPALGAVAALVLVAGVAGALYTRGMDEAAQPHVTSREPAPGAMIDAELPEIEEGFVGRNQAGPPAAPDPDQPAAGEALARDVGLADESTEAALRENRKAPRPGRSGGSSNVNAWEGSTGADGTEQFGVVGGAVEPRKDTAGKKKKVAAAPTTPTLAKERAKEPAVVEKKEPSADPAPPPAKPQAVAPAGRGYAAPPAAEPEPEPAAEAGARYEAEDADDRVADRRTAKSKDDDAAKSLHGQLNRWLAAGKCKEAAKYANDLRDKYPAYYRSKVEPSRRLKSCEKQIVAEAQRRARKRAKPPAAATEPADAYEADKATTAE